MENVMAFMSRNVVANKELCGFSRWRYNGIEYFL